MATLVVYGAAQLLPSGAGYAMLAMMATAAAAYVDQKYTFPHLFGADEALPQNLAGLEMMTQDRGAPRAIGFGRWASVPVHVHWMSENRQSTNNGGGKGGAGNQRQFVNEVRGDIALTLNHLVSEGLARLYGDKNPIWSNPRNWVAYYDHRMAVTAPSTYHLQVLAAAGFDFGRLFAAGDVVKLERFSADNGFWKVESVDVYSVNGRSRLLLVTLDGLTGAAATAGSAVDPASVTRVDDTVIAQLLWLTKVTSQNLLQIDAYGVQSAVDLLHVNDEVELSNWEPVNANVAYTLTTVEVDGPSNQFRKTSGTWTNTPYAGQYITAAGFTNSANNGTHLVLSATSTAITVTTTLTTEAAGGSRTLTGLSMTGGNRWLVTQAMSGTKSLDTGSATYNISGFSIVKTAGSWGTMLPTVGMSIQFVVDPVNNQSEYGIITVFDGVNTITVDRDVGIWSGLVTTIYFTTRKLVLRPLDGQSATMPEHTAKSQYDVPRIRLVNPVLRADIIDGIHIYRGLDTDEPDPTIEAVEGAGNVPAFRGRLWAMLTNFNKSEYGNRTPQFEAIVRRKSYEKVGSVFSELFAQAGFYAYEIDEELRDLPVWGYSVLGPQQLMSVLQPIYIAYDVLTQERGDVVAFFMRKNAEVWSVSQDDLGAISDGNGSDADQPLVVRDLGTDKLKTSLNLKFRDVNFDFQTSAEGYGLRHPGAEKDEENVGQIDLQPMVWDGYSAKARARELLWTAYRNATGIETTLPPSQIHLLENDAIDTVDPRSGKTYRARLTNVELGSNFGLSVAGVVDDITMPASGVAVHGNPPALVTQAPPALLDAHVLDIAAYSNDYLTAPGLFLCAASKTGGYWRGASVFESTDNGTSYRMIGQLGQEHTVGETTTALATGPVGTWQNASLTVQLSGEGILPFSVTREMVLAGYGWWLIGDEIIGASTVTLNLDGTYTLSDLLRGMRNTEADVGAHAIGERAVNLTFFAGTGLFRALPGGAQDVGSVRLYKFVSAGEALQDVDAVTVTVAGWNARPFSPMKVLGTRDGSNNLQLTWLARSRAIAALLPPGPIPSYEPADDYEIEVMVASAVVRLITVACLGRGTRQAVYSAALQTADGITPGNPVTVRVYQVGAFGRSKATEVTV